MAVRLFEMARDVQITFDFSQPVEWRVATSSEATERLIERVAHESQYGHGRLSVREVNLRGDPPALVCRIDLKQGGGGSIGIIHVEDLPDGETHNLNFTNHVSRTEIGDFAVKQLARAPGSGPRRIVIHEATHDDA